MSAQNRCDRIYFAVQQIAIAPDCTEDFTAVCGAQNFSASLDFPLQEIFQLGKLQIYAQLEDLPTVDLQLEKVLDGYPPIWLMSTKDAPTPTLAGRANSRAILALSIFDSTQECAAGEPICTVQFSGVYPESLSYTFNTDDAFSESVSFVGNEVLVSNDTSILNPVDQARSNNLQVDGQFTGDFGPFRGINRRQDFLFAYDPASPLDCNGQVADCDATILPRQIDGISDSGTNDLIDGVPQACVLSVSPSVQLGRTDVNCLGSLAPTCRYVEFPVEVTTEIEVQPRGCPLVSATVNGILNTGLTSCSGGDPNLSNETIRIATCEGTRIYLGCQNKLTSLNYNGADTSGGNVTASYTYRTFNDFTVMHEQDCNPNAAAWWADRDEFLCDLQAAGSEFKPVINQGPLSTDTTTTAEPEPTTTIEPTQGILANQVEGTDRRTRRPRN